MQSHLSWPICLNSCARVACEFIDSEDQVNCKNKLVVLTTEWLPWLQTNWSDSGL